MGRVPVGNESRVERRIRKSRSDGTLSLADLRLGYVPEEIGELGHLVELNLAGNDLKELPSFVCNLTKLTYLNISRNRVTRLPFELQNLTNLRILGLRENPGLQLPPWLGRLDNLEVLTLSNLGLSEIPTFVRSLRNLTTLNIDGNYITELPDWLSELQLAVLDVSDNVLVKLPQSLRKCDTLMKLNVEQNPTLLLPAEIERTHDAKRIVDYYFRTAEPAERQSLNEFKLIVVGRGLVGKTSLVHKLVTGKFQEFRRTPGVNITKWPNTIDGEEVRAHIWDFGGQEIMHGTHRFFMTERALYLILLSGREGTEDQDAEYWLSMVRSFAGDVPVIVLLHKYNDYAFELNRELLRKKHGKDLVFLETDSKTGYGIDALRERICELAKKLPGLKAAWPSAWRQIKDELPDKKENWLTFHDFRAYCAENGVTAAKDQEALAESLHDLGLMLSYRSDEALRHFGVLNPQWVTTGIYRMLNAPELREAGGQFSLESFAVVLPKKTYPAELHPYLLALMRKFQLSHPLDDRGVQHLIPELLTKEEPPNLDHQFPPKECLGFIYNYDTVLPEGLLPRFIVSTYVHRKPGQVWRTGVVLQRGNCRALVRGDVLGRQVIIRVNGVGGRREMLGVIREHFDRIHQSYEKLPVTEIVPIPGHPAAHVRHDLLLKYEANGRDEITVDLDLGLRDFKVKALLDGVDTIVTERSVATAANSWGRKWHLFISYSHKDAALLDQLHAALVPYERTGKLSVWADMLVNPGERWEQQIIDRLDRADIVIPLLSNDFLRSAYCMEVELPRVLKRHQKGECTIVPTVVRACRFDMLPIGKIQAIIPGGKPVDEHEKSDPAWLEVTKQLDRVILTRKWQ